MKSAVAYIERSDGKILVVWNRRFKGWSLPGGKVEEGELVENALARELREETGLKIASRSNFYDGASAVTDERGLRRHVHVFRVWPVTFEAIEGEPGCPVEWMTREQLLAESPFAEFYVSMFKSIDAGKL